MDASRKETVLAFDLGASSGRAILVGRSGSQLEVKEVHRFANEPVRAGSTLYWDILRLLHEIKKGIFQAHHTEGAAVLSMGIDSWTVDFGLIDRHGEMLGNPKHYRHFRHDAMEEACQKIGREKIYHITGLQFLPFNTLFQLYDMKKRESVQLAHADKLLMIPDLLRYFLTGEKLSEYTTASTTQLFDSTRGVWSNELLEDVRVSSSLFQPPLQPGKEAGKLTRSVSEELLVPPIKMVTVGEHDTASAVAGIPAGEEDFAFLICGTWSLLGTELSRPLITKEAFAHNFTNEGGVYGTIRFLKNIMGLWILQECKRTWEKEGCFLSYDELIEQAKEATPFLAVIDVDANEFLQPISMPNEIKAYCQRTGQRVPKTPGEIVRVALESLALKYRMVLEQVEQVTGKAFPRVYMVGGGIHNRFLCQLTADAIARPVWAGPAEASSLGNAVVQLIAAGVIGDLREARRLIQDSFEPEKYTPHCTVDWKGAYSLLQSLSDQ